jgi:predicted RNA binding protein YcfA (HicA-like mRNA interferase family)
VKLPKDVSGQELVKVLLRVGFVVNRQRGSHIVLRRGNPYTRVVVPDHKQVRPGILRQILTEAGLTMEQREEQMKAMQEFVGIRKERSGPPDAVEYVRSLRRGSRPDRLHRA